MRYESASNGWDANQNICELKWEKSCKTDAVKSDDNAAAANCWKWDRKFSIMLVTMVICIAKWYGCGFLFK